MGIVIELCGLCANLPFFLAQSPRRPQSHTGKGFNLPAALPCCQHRRLWAKSYYRLLNFRNKMLLLPGLRQLTLSYYERKVPGMYLDHQARTLYLDELLLAAASGVRQIVFLGAGFDTRPYRFAEQLKGIRIFEVDHPGTAEWKRQRLHRLGTSTQHVTYAKNDFTTDSLEACLRKNIYEPGEATFYYGKVW